MAVRAGTSAPSSRLRHRPVRWRITAAAAAALLAGCGGVGGSGEERTADGGAVLTTMGFALGDEVASVRAELANAAIAPDTVRVGNDGSFDPQQFLTAVASGTVPDLVFMGRDVVGTYAARGTLLPLADCVARHQVDLSQYREPALAEITLDGQLYGLPEFARNRVLLSNGDALAQAGLTPADVQTRDWAALAATSRALARLDGGDLTRIGFDPKIPDFLPLWAKANGVDMLSPDGRTANLADPRLAEALDYTVGLMREQGGVATFEALWSSFDFFGAGNPMAADTMVAWPEEDYYLNVLANNSPQMPLVAAPFTDRSGNPVNWSTGAAWVIPRAAAHPDEACRWIKAMSDAPTWVAAGRARAQARAAEGKAFTGLYTGNRVADEQIFDELVDLSDQPVYDAAVRTVLDAQAVAFSLPASPAGQEFSNAWKSAVNRVLAGEQDATTSLAQAQAEAQRALDDAPRAAG